MTKGAERRDEGASRIGAARVTDKFASEVRRSLDIVARYDGLSLLFYVLVVISAVFCQAVTDETWLSVAIVAGGLLFYRRYSETVIRKEQIRNQAALAEIAERQESRQLSLPIGDAPSDRGEGRPPPGGP
jgi:hypothetical protein